MNYPVRIRYHDYGIESDAMECKRVEAEIEVSDFSELIPTILQQFKDKNLTEGSHLVDVHLFGEPIYSNPMTKPTIFKKDYLQQIAYFNEMVNKTNIQETTAEISHLVRLMGRDKTEKVIQSIMNSDQLEFI